MERLEVQQMQKQLDVKESNIEHSRFENVCMIQSHFEDVNMTGTKIMNANLSDLEIEGAQLGGAYIHNIGMPPKDHPMYVEGARMRPVKFDDCDLSQSTIRNCNLSGVEISDCNLSGVTLKDCNLTGMTINGIPVEQLLTSFNARG